MPRRCAYRECGRPFTPSHHPPATCETVNLTFETCRSMLGRPFKSRAVTPTLPHEGSRAHEHDHDDALERHGSKDARMADRVG